MLIEIIAVLLCRHHGLLHREAWPCLFMLMAWPLRHCITVLLVRLPQNSSLHRLSLIHFFIFAP